MSAPLTDMLNKATKGFPADKHLRLKEVYIPTGDAFRLCASYSHPETSSVETNSDDLKAILLVHGFAAEKTENGLFSETADELRRKGYFVLAYDWRGLGKSEGDFSNTPLETHVRDLNIVVEWLQRNAGLSNLQICAVGFSLGAALVAKAVQEGTKFGAVVFWSPATRPAKHMWPRYKDACGQLGLERFVVKPDNNVKLGRAILESLRDTDLGDDSFDLGVPLLVCHGSNDSRIPIDASRDCFDRIEQRNINKVFFAEFVGASHSFRPEKQHRQPLINLLYKWLQDRKVRQGPSRKKVYPQLSSKNPSRATRRRKPGQRASSEAVL